jgi:hypothetical protein
MPDQSDVKAVGIMCNRKPAHKGKRAMVDQRRAIYGAKTERFVCLD